MYLSSARGSSNRISSSCTGSGGGGGGISSSCGGGGGEEEEVVEVVFHRQIADSLFQILVENQLVEVEEEAEEFRHRRRQNDLALNYSPDAIAVLFVILCSLA